jgi:single-strand DNA-binding protein
MPSLNKVYLIGNITRDPELRYTPKGTAVVDISLAINRVTGGGETGNERKEETTFVDVTQSAREIGRSRPKRVRTFREWAC